MQSKNELLSPVTNILSTSLYAARVVVNISNVSKHLFFPTQEESRLNVTTRFQQEEKKRMQQVAEDLYVVLK
ncbi:hypothetical protein OQJ25_04920 [Fluoribacter dumoffii]|uniref:Uncharacterized protein n=2 Tax=Fluoribacter dumoffii TaxID=463 RepID=A0A377G9B4_9GAMM|nr:hypothetical protein [Fluoribacter dumoffii]KTC89962.1 hypothetical protein Ldum_1030 [Fluoribacter dumoffii NY 23]MCW8496443.1 hypothetical protein [Fluoribacter dumoffii]STO21080.1 Uncharacterised protein [Fluoribacter dumoffii]